MVLYASSLLAGRRLSLDLAAVPSGVTVTVLPPPCPIPVQPIDFSHAEMLIELGRQEARRYLAHQAKARRARTERPAVSPPRAA